MIPLDDANPTRIRPYVTWSIIALCCVVFAYQFLLGADAQSGEALIAALGVIPAVVLGRESLPADIALIPPIATMLTSMFLHGGFMHLAGNMLYLWVFGNNIEDAMGHGRFVIFYLLCGVCAAAAQIVVDPASVAPMIGASGAISGVLGAYLLLYPRARVLLALPPPFIFITIGRYPAVFVLGIWFVMQFLMIASQSVPATAAPGGNGVAFAAHIGGFIAGMLLIPFFKAQDVPLWRAT